MPKKRRLFTRSLLDYTSVDESINEVQLKRKWRKVICEMGDSEEARSLFFASLTDRTIDAVFKAETTFHANLASGATQHQETTEVKEEEKDEAIADYDENDVKDILNTNTKHSFFSNPDLRKRLPAFLLAKLQHDNFKLLTASVTDIVTSENGKTTKLLISLEDGYEIETVILRHNKRTTICVSSQAGCKMGCTFCATGALGFEANVTSGEVLQQLVFAQRFLSYSAQFDMSKPRRITNVVFMGMGEPLNNFLNLVHSLKSLVHRKRFGLSPTKICVSTVGVTGNLKKLHCIFPEVKLALSLHAPTQPLREQIIPTARMKGCRLHELIACLQFIVNKQRLKYPTKPKMQQIMIEYILIHKVNDSKETCLALCHLLATAKLKGHVLINLIPYNPIYNPKNIATTYEAPPLSSIEVFHTTLLEHQFFCTVRTEMGQDVNGACGQLALIKKQAPRGPVQELEDLCDNSAGSSSSLTTRVSSVEKETGHAYPLDQRSKHVAWNLTRDSFLSRKNGLGLGALLCVTAAAVVGVSLAKGKN